MTNYGLVSIIVPTYNSAKYIQEAIDSVLSQTYTNWELLVTDDCSGDETISILERYVQSDNRIKLFCLKENGGAAKARNTSIRQASGRYIAFLDSDDWWYPNKLQKQLEFMSTHHYEFIYSAFEYADENLNVTGVSYKPRKISYKKLKMICSIGTPGVIYDTKRIGKVYMPEIKTGEDWGTWLDLSQRTRYAYAMNTPLWKYRVQSQSLSSNKLQQISYSLKLYRTILGYSKIESLFMVLFVFIPHQAIKMIRIRWDSYWYLKRIIKSNVVD